MMTAYNYYDSSVIFIFCCFARCHVIRLAQRNHPYALYINKLLFNVDLLWLITSLYGYLWMRISLHHYIFSNSSSFVLYILSWLNYFRFYAHLKIQLKSWAIYLDCLKYLDPCQYVGMIVYTWLYNMRNWKVMTYFCIYPSVVNWRGWIFHAHLHKLLSMIY